VSLDHLVSHPYILQHTSLLQNHLLQKYEFLDHLGYYLSATIHTDLKRTLVAMSERTGLSISQVTDEVLYTGLVEMQDIDELEE
jgi:hypothetical protein